MKTGFAFKEGRAFPSAATQYAGKAYIQGAFNHIQNYK